MWGTRKPDPPMDRVLFCCTVGLTRSTGRLPPSTATERGRAGCDKYRYDFSMLNWRLASPKRNFDDAAFHRSAASFDNPDHLSIVTRNYGWRIGWAMASRNGGIWSESAATSSDRSLIDTRVPDPVALDDKHSLVVDQIRLTAIAQRFIPSH